MRSQDRPEAWFDLKKYLAAARFTPEQWAQQIARRLAVQTALTKQDRSTTDRLMEGITDAPLAPWPSAQKNGSRLVSHLPYTTGTVYPLTFHDVQVLRAAQHETQASDASACDEALRERMLWGLDRFPHLVVDLDARDEQIKSDFARWLQAYRTAAMRPQAKTLARANLDRWHQDKLLPYFDLTAWSEWSGTPLTQARIVALLFPTDTDATPDNLKAIRSKLKSALSWTTYSSLCNLADSSNDTETKSQG